MVFNHSAGNIQIIDPYVSELLNSFTGMVQYFTSVPDGWLYCDGSLISRGLYRNLFAAIGDRYGSGDFISTFNIPDLRAEFIRGYDNTGAGTNQDIGEKRSWATEIHNGIIGLFNNRFVVYGNASVGIFFYIGASSTTADIKAGGGSDGRVYIYSDSSRQINTDFTYNDTRPRNMALIPCIKY